MSLLCPTCNEATEVLDSRQTTKNFTTRRRVCFNGHRHSTREEWVNPAERQLWTLFKQVTEQLKREIKNDPT